MEAQEQAHVKCFENLVLQRRVRPSLFLPLWEFAGFVLGMYAYNPGHGGSMASRLHSLRSMAQLK